MNTKKSSPRQEGQVILILILVMTVALSIGLSVVQKSLVDVSTSSKVEQSSRAFSAAEAGIEKALQPGSTCGAGCVDFSENSSKADVSGGTESLPVMPAVNNRQEALEYPSLLAKEDVAQVWLADLRSVSNPPTEVYNQSSLDVFWGNSSTDKTAIELTLVYYRPSTTSYHSDKWFLDNISASRSAPNQFEQLGCPGTYTFGSNTYQCKKTLDFSATRTAYPSAVWILLRVRLLYNSTSQPFAVQATGTRGLGACVSGGCWLPPQARSIISTGISGETQRKVKVFQLENIVPSLFDYAIFSAGEIRK